VKTEVGITNHIAVQGLRCYQYSVHPVINNEEFIGKTVGRRKRPVDTFAYIDPLQRSLGPIRVKRGVYHFRTHKEADQWLMDHLTRKLES